MKNTKVNDHNNSAKDRKGGPQSIRIDKIIIRFGIVV